jgi:hypothetical protein
MNCILLYPNLFQLLLNWAGTFSRPGQKANTVLMPLFHVVSKLNDAQTDADSSPSPTRKKAPDPVSEKPNHIKEPSFQTVRSPKY